MTKDRVRITLDSTVHSAFRKAALSHGLSVPSWMRSICLSSLIQGTIAALEDSLPTPPATSEPDVSDAPRVCTPDDHILLETEHYRRGYDAALADLVRRDAVKPKSA